MTEKKHRDREAIMHGRSPMSTEQQVLRDYYNNLLPEVAPSLEERVEWLLGELIRRHIDHQDACRLAWELYLAGTGQTPSTFKGVHRSGPVEEVRMVLLAAALRSGPETGNVSANNDDRKDHPS